MPSCMCTQSPTLIAGIYNACTHNHNNALMAQQNCLAHHVEHRVKDVNDAKVHY